MAGKLTFTLQDFQEAATKWRSDLLMLPIIGIQDTLKYMTARPGIRYKEQVGALSGDARKRAGLVAGAASALVLGLSAPFWIASA